MKIQTSRSIASHSLESEERSLEDGNRSHRIDHPLIAYIRGFTKARRQASEHTVCLRLKAALCSMMGTLEPKPVKRCVQLAVACGPGVRFLRHSAGPPDSQAAHDGGAR